MDNIPQYTTEPYNSYSVYSVRNGKYNVVDCSIPLFSYLRLAYTHFGNSPEGRKAYKEYKRLWNKHKDDIINMPLRHVEWQVEKCGVKKSDVISVLRENFRYLPEHKKYRKILQPHIRRYLLALKNKYLRFNSN